MKQTSLLIFGLDGATWKIMDPWIKQGKLPFLKRLIENGVSGTLKSTIPPLTSTAWASFQTGAPPEKHGILGFIKKEGKIFTAHDLNLPTFWQTASQHQKTVALVNLPLTFPPQPLNGALVSSFLTPPGQPFAYPKTLEKELIKLGYRASLDFEHDFFLQEGKIPSRQKRMMVKNILLKIIDKRKQAALHILGKKPWDIFFVFFKSTDTVQHLFWKEKETLEVYQKIDKGIKELVEEFQKKNPCRKINILVVSDHGFHPVAKKEICFYPLFVRLGLLPVVPGFWLKLLRGLRKVTKIKKLEKLAYPTRIKITDFGVHLENTKKGEIKTLQKKLAKVKVGNKKIFSEVKIINSKIEGFPQILWLTNPYFVANADPLSGAITYPHTSHFKARHHSDRNGIFIAAGSNIKKSPQRIFLPLVDLPVNILRLLGITPPKTMQGKERPDIFLFPQNLSTLSTSTTLPKKQSLPKISREGEKLVIKRLKALGYVD